MDLRSKRKPPPPKPTVKKRKQSQDANKTKSKKKPPPPTLALKGKEEEEEEEDEVYKEGWEYEPEEYGEEEDQDLGSCPLCDQVGDHSTLCNCLDENNMIFD